MSDSITSPEHNDRARKLHRRWQEVKPKTEKLVEKHRNSYPELAHWRDLRFEGWESLTSASNPSYLLSRSAFPEDLVDTLYEYQKIRHTLVQLYLSRLLDDRIQSDLRFDMSQEDRAI